MYHLCTPNHSTKHTSRIEMIVVIVRKILIKFCALSKVTVLIIMMKPNNYYPLGITLTGPCPICWWAELSHRGGHEVLSKH